MKAVTGIQINFSILFDDGDRYFHPESAGIISWELGEMRGTDYGEAQDNFQNYSIDTFDMDISGNTMHDLIHSISVRTGFVLEKMLSFYGGSPLYILIADELVSIQNLEVQIQSFLDMYPVTDILQAYFIFSSQAGDIWPEEDGLRYFYRSREAGRHHKPHIHVDYKHEAEASISLETGNCIKISGRIPSKVLKKIKSKVLDNQVFLLDGWRKYTNGLCVDLNHSFGYIGIS